MRCRYKIIQFTDGRYGVKYKRSDSLWPFFRWLMVISFPGDFERAGFDTPAQAIDGLQKHLSRPTRERLVSEGEIM